MQNAAADKPRLYVETSVVSYYAARPSRDVIALARQEITREWWTQHLDDFEAFVSVSVLEEAEKGDRAAARKRLQIARRFPVLQLTPEVEHAAELYLKHGIIPEVSTYDVFHLAFASVYKLDILVTWNFRHLANAFVYGRLHSFNHRRALHTPIICTPEELLGE